MSTAERRAGDGQPLLGRGPERRELERLLAGARAGSSGVLALVGEAGIGKSTLLEHAVAGRGQLALLRARAVEAEQSVPFAALSQLLRPALGLLRRIPPPQAQALEAALALRPAASSERFSIGAGTLSLIAAYAEEQATLVVIDDAHLLDAASSGALSFALRRLLAEPVAVLIAVREGESSLIDEAALPTLHLGGLEREAAVQLLAGLPGAAADRLYRATGGNPLALLELREEAGRLEAAEIDVPVAVSERLARAFTGRLPKLEPAARELLLLAAVSDRGDLATLARAAGTRGLNMALLDTAVGEGLVRLGEGRVEFRHPLVRASVYWASEPEQRRHAHRALAEALPDRDEDRRAWHLARASTSVDDDVASALEQSGERALARGAEGVAAEAFATAAGLSGGADRRGRLFVRAAGAAWLAGLAERAQSLLEQAGEAPASAAEQAAVEHLRGRIAARTGPVMDGHGLLMGAAARLASSEPQQAIEILAEAVDACFHAGRVEEMAAAAAWAATLLGPAPAPRSRFLAAITRALALILAGQGEAGAESARVAVALAEQHAELREDHGLVSWVVIAPLLLRERVAGRVLIEEAITAARTRVALGLLPWLLMLIGRDEAAGSDWAGARVSYDEAIMLALETGQRVDLAAARAGLAWLEALEGREQECRSDAEGALVLCRELGVGLYEAWALRALAELELGAGRAGVALERLLELERHLAALGLADVDLSAGAELVECHLRLGQRSEAQAVAMSLDRQAREKGQPWSLARAERCRGLLADEEGFEAHFRLALAHHGETPDRFEAARTRLAFGARLRRARRRRESREQLADALAAFEQLGARRWAEQAGVELAASGAAVRRRGPSGRDELTAQELHIAALLAEGKTTREAAAAVFLSPKTIEYHLRSIYRKLGISSRSELAAALTGNGGERA